MIAHLKWRALRWISRRMIRAAQKLDRAGWRVRTYAETRFYQHKFGDLGR